MGPGTQEDEFRSYKLFTDKLNLFHSFYACLKIGANLALPMNLQQSDQLTQISQGHRVYLAADSAGHGGIFLTSGFAAEGGDQPVNYFKFAKNEPNNAGGKDYCIENTPSGWVDNDCSEGLMRVCQAPRPEICTTLPSPDLPGFTCYKRIN